MDRRVVAHSLDRYLFVTGSWIYNQISELNDWESIVICNQKRNPEIFPSDSIYSLDDYPKVIELALAGYKRSLLLAKGRADLGFKWNIALMITQIPGLYLGAKLGGTVGVAIAFAVLQSLYKIFGYPVLIRTLLGPCLREYVTSMWPSLWMSFAMGGAVLCIGIFLQSFPLQFTLIIQILCGVAVYFGLMVLSQKMFLFEIKEMLWPGKISG